MHKTTISPSSTDPSQSALTDADAQTVVSTIRHSTALTVPLVESLLRRAENRAWMGAIIHIASANAMQQAAQRDGVDGAIAKAPLHGLPVVVKDNIDVAGLPTTSGSPVLAGHVPRRSASALEKLLDAGAVVVGKTNLHELCFGITSNNAAYGPVRNPYAPDRIAGGSSGGTAAAIAGGLAPAGIGSDTGGSLRIPAALCGVVGFRPTTGRWPSDGVVTISNTRDTLGPMARTVADCALLDAVVCGEPTSLATLNLQGVRIGVPKPLFWQTLEPSMAHAAQAVLALLAKAGVELVECDVGIDNDQCTQAGMTVALYESLPCLQVYMASHNLAFDAAKITSQIASPDVRGVFESLLGPQAPTAEAYLQALQTYRPALRQAYAQCFARHNLAALIFPTTPLPAALIGEDDTVLLAGQQVPTFLTYTRNVGPGSFAGIPGISLPMGCNDAGLPLGIALDGPIGSDRQLLALAHAVQALLPRMPRPRAFLQTT
jgi:indoleacetamide hydrolase